MEGLGVEAINSGVDKNESDRMVYNCSQTVFLQAFNDSLVLCELA